jgi:hypothetical protein
MGRFIPAKLYAMSAFFGNTLTITAATPHELSDFCLHRDGHIDDPLPPHLVDEHGTTVVHFSLSRFATLDKDGIPPQDAWGWIAMPSGTCTATAYFQTIHVPATRWVERVAYLWRHYHFALNYQCTTGDKHGTHIASANGGIEQNSKSWYKHGPRHPLPLIPAMPAAK